MALILAAQMTPMQAENHTSTNIQIESHSSEEGGVSTLSHVRMTIKSLYEKLLRSFKSVLKYLRTRLCKRENESI